MPRILYVLLVIGMTATTAPAKTQTTLAAGDIAFTGYNALDNTVNGPTANDDICFLLLKNITAGTTIYFTDFGWRSDAAAFQTAVPCGPSTGAVSDGILKWTAAANMTYGTQVNIRCKNNLSASVGTVTAVQATYNVATDYLSLAIGGDQVFAYQGSFASPTLIAGISLNGAWDATVTNCQFGSSVSVLPAALSANNYAIAIVPEVDNARLKTSVQLTGVAATDRATIHNVANWDLSDPSPFALPAAITVLPVLFTYIHVDGERPFVQWGVAGGSREKIYAVERSLDGQTFREVAVVPGSGKEDYAWTDAGVKSAFYRIQARDRDGKGLYSPVVKFTGRLTGERMALFANGRTVLLRLEGVRPDSYLVSVFTPQGQVVQERYLQHRGTNSAYPLVLDATLRAGMYLVQVRGNHWNKTEKIVLY